MTDTSTGDPTADLRIHLHELTQPHEVQIRDQGRLIGTRTDPALLAQLRAARHSNIGHGSGAQIARHERATLNFAASELYTSLERRIRQWALRSGYQPTIHGHTEWPDVEDLLTTWYSRVNRNHDFNPGPYAATLTNWVDAITDLIVNPPLRYAIRGNNGKLRPCPHCGQQWAIRDIGGEQERVPALEVVDRTPEPDSVITCRNCGVTWHGNAGAEALADLLLTRPVQVIHHEASA